MLVKHPRLFAGPAQVLALATVVGLLPTPAWAQDPAPPTAAAPAPAPVTDPSPEPALLLDAVRVEGNERTSTAFIVDVLGADVGGAFSEAHARRGRLRLLALGFFEDVRLALEKGGARGRVVLVVRIEERPTYIVEDVFLGSDSATPFWGGLGLADRNFLGTGLGASAAFVAGEGQQGYRLGVTEPAVLGGALSASLTALWNEGSEPLPPAEPGGTIVRVPYRRRGGAGSVGLPLTSYTTAFVNARVEEVDGLLDGAGRLGILGITLARDSRNDHFLPTAGGWSVLALDVSDGGIGSDWDFMRARASHDHHLHLGGGQSLKLSASGGWIRGDAPFFERFFIGDLDSFTPDRALGLSYGVRAPVIIETLGTGLERTRYEEVFARIGVEWAIPLVRGKAPWFYRSDFFVGGGLFALADAATLGDLDWGDAAQRPLGATVDAGLRFDTPVGVFALSLSNFLNLAPGE